MTVRALLGLAAFNGVLAVVGTAALWALWGFGSWRAVVQGAGLAYMLGVALVGTTLSLELVAGIPFSFVSVLLTAAGLSAFLTALRWPFARYRPARSPASVSGLGPVAIAFGLLIVLYLEALFRSARLTGLSAWDGWAFWVPKGKAIYYFGGLDEQFFRELGNPTYPPLLPALDASAFHFMGSADVVTLHVQFWFLACGFVAAIAGLLAPRVPAPLLWPMLLLALVAPRVVGRNLDPQADFLLDYLFALAALMVALWLVDREPWQLATAGVFMAAALLTKREGQLFVACIVVAALAASWRQRRYAWPRLVAVAVAGGLVAIPWHVWFSSRNLTGELPASGAFSFFDNLDRGWPAFESAITAAFDYRLWLLAAPLVAAGVALAFLAGARTLPTFVLALYGLMLAGLVWVLWSFTELEVPLTQDESVNPIVRLSGSLVVASAALLPLLFDAAWRGADGLREDAP